MLYPPHKPSSLLIASCSSPFYFFVVSSKSSGTGVAGTSNLWAKRSQSILGIREVTAVPTTLGHCSPFLSYRFTYLPFSCTEVSSPSQSITTPHSRPCQQLLQLFAQATAPSRIPDAKTLLRAVPHARALESNRKRPTVRSVLLCPKFQEH